MTKLLVRLEMVVINFYAARTANLRLRFMCTIASWAIQRSCITCISNLLIKRHIIILTLPDLTSDVKRDPESVRSSFVFLLTSLTLQVKVGD